MIKLLFILIYIGFGFSGHYCKTHFLFIKIIFLMCTCKKNNSLPFLSHLKYNRDLASLTNCSFLYDISVCSEYNHVRTWSVTRFRGMISTQPGSTPLASFKVISLEDYDPNQSYMAGNDFGEIRN